MKILSFVSAAVLWIFFICGASFSTERYVSLNGTNDGTGGYITWSGASTNIQDAVNQCADNDVVWVTNGTYYCWSNSAYAGYTSMVTVVRASNIRIQSMNGPAFTIVDANYPNFTNRCFYIMSNATLSGFTITNGHACDVTTEGGGGGVFINTSGRVTNCWITGNTTTNGITKPDYCPNGGGGVYCRKGGELLNCIIYANSSTDTWQSSGVFVYLTGGTNVIRDCIISNNYNSGVSVYNVTSVAISNCTFINNNGNGLFIYAIVLPIVDDCRMIGNTACGLASAGAVPWIVRNCQMYNNVGAGANTSAGVFSNCVVSSNAGYGVSMAGSALVIDCTIVSNYSSGVYMTGGTMRNCLIANNYTSARAGGMYLYFPYADKGRVENCTIVSNLAIGTGSGIYKYPSAGTGIVVNTICYSNNGTDNLWDHTPGSLFFYNSCITPTNGLLGSNNTTNPPALVNIAARNYRLSRSSPCINTGSNMDWMIGVSDLDRHRRLDRYSGVVDMGCYEYVPRGTIYGVR